MNRSIFLCYYWILHVLTATAVIAVGATDDSCSSSTTANGECPSPDAVQPQPQCGLFMAPSTLGENANLGMYMGDHDLVLPSDNETTIVVLQRELVLPMLFRNWKHNWYRPRHNNDGILWDRYIWEGYLTQNEYYKEQDVRSSNVIFVPGIGCTINSRMDLHNVHSTHGSVYDTSGYHRSRDPGVGASTPYHESITTLTRPQIRAGEEIFAEYGRDWIPQIPQVQDTRHQFMDQAEGFLRDVYHPWILQQSQDGILSDRLLEGLWKFTTNFPNANPSFSVLPKHMTWSNVQEELQQMPLPEDDSVDWWGEEEAPSSKYIYPEEISIIRTLIRNQGRRSLEWLYQHGRCCDHMEPRTSTIPQAGKGAFATRFLPQGSIVGYSPLVPVIFEGSQVYDIRHSQFVQNAYPSEYAPKKDHSKMDLVINYSFGHPNSTILLTPYGCMVNYINHASSGYDGNYQPNVKVVWPKEEMIAHKPEWIEHMDIHTLRHTVEKVGLSLDYIALRDIQEGEEILLDYGIEWETAWKDHVKNYQLQPQQDEYMHSTDFWKQHDKESFIFPTPEEDLFIPPNLHTVCHDKAYFLHTDGNYYWYKNSLKYATLKNPLRIPCRVVGRIFGKDIEQYYYHVEMNVSTSTLNTVAAATTDDSSEETTTTTIIVHGIPHEFIYLVDKTFSQDWHLPNAFRHPMAIPNDIFPEAWKNLLFSEENVAEDTDNADTTNFVEEFIQSTKTNKRKKRRWRYSKDGQRHRIAAKGY